MTHLLKRFAVLAALAASTAAASAETVKIKFADLGATTNNLYQYFGVEKGIYAKHGVDLEFVTFLKGGPEIIAAAASQQVDFGSLGTPILTGISRGIPIKVVGAPALKGQEFVLLGRNDVACIADLKGKTVAVSSVGGGQSQALRYILRAHGLKEDDVKVIAYGAAPNGYLSLTSGQVAAVVLSEPNVSRVVVEGAGKILAEAVDYFGRYQHSYVFASKKFIAEHPEAITRYFEADREALRYAKTHLDELSSYGQAKLNLDAKILGKVFERNVDKWDESLTVDPEGLFNAVRIVQEVGDISKGYVPKLDEITDLRFVK